MIFDNQTIFKKNSMTPHLRSSKRGRVYALNNRPHKQNGFLVKPGISVENNFVGNKIG